MVLKTAKGKEIHLNLYGVLVACIVSLTLLAYMGFSVGAELHQAQLTSYQEVNAQLVEDNKLLAEKITEAQKLLEEQKALIKATEAQITTLRSEIEATSKQLEAELERTKILDKGGN